MNEHIAHYKVWSATYLMWANSNIDRIVKETVKKHKEEMKEEREQNKPLNLYAKMSNSMRDVAYANFAKRVMADNAFMHGIEWNAKDIKIGSTLKIKLPEEPSPPSRVPSLLSLHPRKVLQWLNSNLLQIGQKRPLTRPK